MKQIESIAEDALDKLIVNITDDVFLTIQADRVLMQQYLEQVTEHGRDTVNKAIGKYVRVRLGLTNEGRENEPVSTLIASYEKHGLGIV